MNARISLPKRLNVPNGPGQIGEIQVVTPKVSLRSELDPNLILGRPTVVAIVDVCGRFFYGLAFTVGKTLEIATSLAIENALTNKKDYCAQFGISIGSEEWPVAFLPETLLIDPQLSGSMSAEDIVRHLGVTFTSKPTDNPDLGTIFDRLLIENKQMAEVVLTPREFLRVLIHAIRNYHAGLLNDYPLSSAMIADHVQPRPIDLLNWGIANTAGIPRRITLENARRLLLPNGNAQVTSRGIYFQGLFYACERATTERWFECVRRRGSFKVKVAYNPMRVDSIYLTDSNGIEFETCQMIACQNGFSGCTWKEVNEWFRCQRKAQIARLEKEGGVL